MSIFAAQTIHGPSIGFGFVAIPNPHKPQTEEDKAEGKVPHDIVSYSSFVEKLLKKDTNPMVALHIALGIAGEAGEFADAIKKQYIYGKDEDLENIIEELGDLLWYVQAAMNHYNLRPDRIIQANAMKLAQRYSKLTFSKEDAIARADKKA